jgi:4-carboxymuconolactone decarboxylase
MAGLGGPGRPRSFDERARHQEIIWKLAIRDDAYLDEILAREHRDDDGSGLEPKTLALVRVAALIAIDAASPSYMSMIEAGARNGVTLDEFAGTLIAVLPAVGSARVVSAAPKLGLALGYDVAAALEQHESRRRGLRRL